MPTTLLLRRTIEKDGLLWGKAEKKPIAYGVFKLTISAVVEDEKISVDWMEEKITEFEDYVQSVDVAAFETSTTSTTNQTHHHPHLQQQHHQQAIGPGPRILQTNHHQQQHHHPLTAAGAPSSSSSYGVGVAGQLVAHQGNTYILQTTGGDIMESDGVPFQVCL